MIEDARPNLAIDRTWDGQHIGDDEAVELRLSQRGDTLRVEVDAPFHGDPPPPGPPGPTWALWEHEVVELFLLGPDGRYTEIELGPGGHHLVLQLHGVRNIIARELPISFSARVSGDRWTGLALIPWALLPEGALRANATAIHGQGTARRYLAWAPMPGDKPDFHRLEYFQDIHLS